MSLAKLRSKQIKSLESNSIIHRQISEDSWEIPCNTPLGTIYIILFTPPLFPEIKPRLIVKPLVRHDWLDAEGVVVGHQGLMNWGLNTSLGRVIKELMVEFQLRPPQKIIEPQSVQQQQNHSFQAPIQQHHFSPQISHRQLPNVDPLTLSLDSKS
jgi:hypothetical protein